MQKIASYIELAGCAQGLFLLVALLYLPSKGYIANKILALLLLSVSMLLLWSAIHDAQLLLQWPNLMGFGPPLLFTIGPLLYLYVKALTSPDFSWKNIYLLHFVPALLALLSFTPFYLQRFEEKQQIISTHYIAHAHTAAADLLPGLHFLLYLFPSLLLLSASKKKVKQYVSLVSISKLNWLSRLIWGFVLAFAGFAALYFFTGLHIAGNVFTITHALFIFMIGYLGLKNPLIFQPEAPADSTAARQTLQQVHEKAKYEKSSLPEEVLVQHETALEQLMREEKIYRNSELSLKDLADKLSLSPHHLSQLLNQRLQVTFYDYINHYRIAEVKEALHDPQKHHLTILALAFEAGFKSKSVFNGAFKQHTGLTPSAYKKQSSGS